MVELMMPMTPSAFSLSLLGVRRGDDELHYVQEFLGIGVPADLFDRRHAQESYA
jgi:hypothetical protein